MPPYRDKEIHRHDHELPKEVKEEQVEGQEHAEDTCQCPKQVHMEKPCAHLYLSPGTDDRDEAEKQRQYYQQETESVQCQVKTNAELRQPRAGILNEPSAAPFCRRYLERLIPYD